ncbi:MAG TPA: FHA domain-containing protein [Polyangia bacterium]|nr:FHA domain-containing protein [Polyangia bacterium]
MIKCGRCGNVNGADVLFCQYCGTRLAADRLPAAGPAAAIVAVPGAAPAPSNRATDRLVEGGPNPMAAAARVAQQNVGFKLIVVHRDGTDGITYNLLGDQIDIGRTEGDLLFEDPHLAPRHARVSASLTGRVLTPLETRNGVYVRLRGSIDLQDGDYILVGKQVLRFELLTDIERNLRPAVEHGVVVFGTPVRPPWARIRQITPAAITRDVYHLTRPEVVIGRESGDVVFSDDEFMSRRHVQIAFRNGRGHLEDLGSSNGTFLRLRGPHGLSSGDLIRMGDELLRFEIG